MEGGELSNGGWLKGGLAPNGSRCYSEMMHFPELVTATSVHSPHACENSGEE